MNGALNPIHLEPPVANLDRRPDAPTPPDPSDGAPLSLPQEGLWFLDQMAGGGAPYVIDSVTRHRGRLDSGALERSLRTLIARHDSLRTGFNATPYGPRQHVLPVAAALQRFSLQQVSLAPAEATQAALAERIGLSLARPFDLTRAPLVRAELLRVAPDDHVLVLAVHHIVSDGTSMSVIRRELGQLYAQGGEGAGLAALPLTFSECVYEERRRLERDGLEAQLAFWRENLRDLQTLNLPIDRSRPAQMTYEGRTLSLPVAPPLAAALRALATQQQATLFMSLLAAFNVLLMRYTGQHDVAIGVPVASRTGPGQREVVGCFANTLVMRNRIEGGAGFNQLLKQVHQTTRTALVHEMPFARLVAALSPEREAGRNPLYQVSFTLDNFPHHVLDLDGLANERVKGQARTSMFDLSLTMVDSASGLEALFEYRVDLFEPQTIALMAKHFVQLLGSIVADPDGALDRLPLMDAAEQHRLLVEWNRRLPARACELPVHTLFRAQARATPEAVALRFGSRNLSYRELDRMSDRLAHTLRALDVGPEVVVGLCMQRCIGMAVALMAIFKAGGVFLPLDPAQPTERLQLMLEDSAPAVVLTQADLVDGLRRVETARPPRYHLIADDGGAPGHEPLAEVEAATRKDQLAYLIYTSGSTGTPKAVQLMHGGLSNHVLWMNDALGLTPGDRVLQKTSSSFDASLWEFFSPLSCGATIVIAEPDVQHDMGRLAAAIGDQDISVVQFVPSELRVVLGELNRMACPRLRYVLCGGEAMDRALALSFRQGLPGVRLGNFYGPTEATVDSAWYEVGEHLPPRPLVPIGRPITSAELYVLDALLQPQPVNVPGELYVGGAGVGRGYQNRPQLSAERFLPNPFRAGETMYRTGDLARWLPDGVVEYIGRSDDQVKLRGFRIELGEIEARLLEHPDVSEGLVRTREDRPGDVRLVAYVVLRNGVLDTPGLRDHLRGSLPDYMLPQHYVALEALPRLPNGKVDRHRLPAPRVEPRLQESTNDAPSTPAEITLADIWCEVLGLEVGSVARCDNFFDLGGDSLRVGRAVIAFQRRSGVRLDANRMIFESLAQLARGIDLPAGEAAPQEAPAEPAKGWFKRLFKRG